MSSLWGGVLLTIGVEVALLVGWFVVGEARQTIHDRKRHLGYSWRWECPSCRSRPASKTWPWYFHGRVARWFAQRQVWRDHEHFIPKSDPV